jgi:prepilin-type N-terminal cleavage/methylation domain-containing protein
MKSNRGLTVMELLVTMSLFSLLVVWVVPGLESFFFRMEVHAALRTITSALSDNQSVQAEVISGSLRLSRDDGQGWRVIRSFELGGKVAVRANSRPVFSPLGFVSPLCTITLEKQKRVWLVVLSMYGRIKVYGNS